MDLSDALDEVASIINSRLSGLDGVAIEREGDRRIVIVVPSAAADRARAAAALGLLHFCEPLTDADGNIAIVRDGTVATGEGTCEPVRDAEGNLIVEVGAKVEFVRWPPTDYSTNEIVWQPASAEVDGVELEMTGEFLQGNTSVRVNQITSEPQLLFEWNGTGSEISGEVTQRLAENNLQLAAFLDGEPILGEDGRIIAPAVQGQITSSGTITGLSLKEAQNLSALLNAGRLPLAMEVVEVREVED